MIQCPDCRQMIPDDSAFCDQCGKELKWCPECRRPKRGTECPVCGSDLIPGRKYLASPVTPGPDRVSPDHSVTPGPSPVISKSPSALVGNGWRLTLQEGPFGCRGGIWPELSSCPYVSGNHGKIVKSGADWVIEDSGSTNGTYVNGARIQRQVLKNRDRVRIATLDLTVE